MNVEVSNTSIFYQKIANITDQMLVAVHDKNWEKLTELELLCAECIDTNSTKSHKNALSETELQAKVASLKKILSNDKKIRHLLEPWMNEFNVMMKIKSD